METTEKSFSAEAIVALKNAGRLEALRLSYQGRVRDLALDTVVVHVGKPEGSITGWVGSTFWQVWVEPFDAPDAVHARIDHGDIQQWRFDVTFNIAERLDAAKVRAIAEVKAYRAKLLAHAEARLAQIQSV
jgi:hypothetical protein